MSSRSVREEPVVFLMKLSSPAKINLFLRILGKRPDGYHELASLFQVIDLCDSIDFSFSDKDSLTCSDPGIPLDGSNLILKAADLFRKKTGLSFGLKAHLDKKIPFMAGLGGGSSNAATTLWALNQMHGSMIGLDRLKQWAGEIGSDVAFFLTEGTAYCTGRGEILEDIPSLPSTSLWIVKPWFGISTPKVYGKLDVGSLERRDPKISLRQFLDGEPSFYNDLEGPAFSLMPELRNLKEQLLSMGYKAVLMSGSGSSFFCVGAMPPKVEGAFVFPATFLNRSAYSWYTI